MENSERRYDIDWLRVIAIFLLLFYHMALIFQPWGKMIGFIQSEETSDSIWIPMAMINVWRIPLLFFVSGMGVCFALRRRDWKELLIDRGKRILLPLLFGSFLIVPVHSIFVILYYGGEPEYGASMGHLWFLGNICIYITQVIGFAFLNQNYDYKFFRFFKTQLKRPWFIYIFALPYVLEVFVASPQYFSMYVGNAHGFLIGMVSFILGFFFITFGKEFWNAVERVKIFSLVIAVTFYLVRILWFNFEAPVYFTSFESINWIFALFGFAYKYLNKPGKALAYLSEAVYPVYIVHMIFLFASAYYILPLGLPIELNIISIVLLTFAGSFVSFEILRRIKIIRPLFGMKWK